MERLDRLADYFKEKERKKLNQKIKDITSTGLPEMSRDEIRLACLENNGFETPELNDKLYLHFRGFKRIENLEEFTGCKALWLDSNGLEVIENLNCLVQLRCLYLSKNLISKIQGLDNLQQLVLLDLSNNRLTQLDNLYCCPNLQTVNVSRNFLASAESIESLKECKALLNLDITNNRLPDDESIIDTLQALPVAVNISINGNETTKLPSFRKRMIAGMPRLGYLDRPVEELERVAAEAFVRGGVDAETVAREAFRAKKLEDKRKETEDFRAWQKKEAERRASERASGTQQRSFMLQMSSEELETRQAEAAAAAESERAMLSQGVETFAKKYWEIEGRQESGIDPFEEASRQILEPKPPAPISDDNEHVNRQEGEEEEIDIDLDIKIDIEETAPLQSNEKEVVPVTESLPPLPPPPAVVAVIPPAIVKDPNEAKEQELREQRVAESFMIFKRQMEENKKGGGASSSSSSVSNVKGSWDLPSNPQQHQEHQERSFTAPGPWNASSYLASSSSSSVSSSPRSLYWTETLDIELANNVRKHVFNFDLVAAALKALATSGILGLTVKEQVELITAEVCRVRWTQLDAAKWSESAPETSALDTVYKICVSSSVLGAGHGSQPTFQALSAMAAGSLPSYLVPPVSLPSVLDAVSDSDDEQEPVVSNRVTNHEE